MRNIFLLACVCMLYIGCVKMDPIPNASLIPAPFDFVVLNQDTLLIKSLHTKVEMWYDKNGAKTFITDVKVKPTLSSTQYPWYVSTINAPGVSSGEKNKVFYVQVDGGKIDTIFLDVNRLQQPVDGDYHQYVKVNFNGKEVLFDKNQQPALYIFNRIKTFS